MFHLYKVYDIVVQLKYKCFTSIEVFRMAIIQFRVSDQLKDQATEVYKKLGLDLSSAIRMFLMRSVDVNGIPFSTVIEEEKEPYKAYEAARILNEVAQRSKELGLDKMTLEEINEEIRLAREERKRKNSEILRSDRH